MLETQAVSVEVAVVYVTVGVWLCVYVTREVKAPPLLVPIRLSVTGPAEIVLWGNLKLNGMVPVKSSATVATSFISY